MKISIIYFFRLWVIINVRLLFQKKKQNYPTSKEIYKALMNTLQE